MFREIERIKGICPICEDERELRYGKQDEKVNVRREIIEVEARGYYCSEGHFFAELDDEEEKFQEAYREYRRRKGLLQPEEIKEIRITYGLSQEAFAEFLGFGGKTIQRYESGALQDDAHNVLLFFMKDVRNFKGLFMHKRSGLDAKIISKIENNLMELERKSLDRLFHVNLLPTEYEKIDKYFSESANGELALAA